MSKVQQQWNGEFVDAVQRLSKCHNHCKQCSWQIVRACVDYKTDHMFPSFLVKVLGNAKQQYCYGDIGHI